MSEHDNLEVSPGTPSLPAQSSRPHRVLACVLCQQRKVKCDRKFPCANCVKSRVQCVPASMIQRRRRRRFPERDLLTRLREYENLLRENNIKFEPLHKDSPQEKEFRNTDSGSGSDEEHQRGHEPTSSRSSVPVKLTSGDNAKNIWAAMRQGFRDPGNDDDPLYDDVREAAVRRAFEQSVDDNDYLLFGSPITNIELSSLHPDPVRIFRLWQIFLDNVNPLLKAVHTPSLQPRIIEAAGNVSGVDSTLEALMFSIYCMAIVSLSVEECETMFGTPKGELIYGYQLGCRQALSKCGFLRSTERDSLTALFLYLVSVRPSTAHQSLGAMLGVAIRIAQRMGIHNELMLKRYTVFEAEMCRRLWWSLVLFDTRICETGNIKAVTLDPTWDCKVPLNVNDSDIRPGMKELPTNRTKSTDTIFVVIRCKLNDFIRHADFHLDFTAPSLKPVSKHLHSSSHAKFDDLDKLEEVIENQYLKHCDQENPIHFMAIWTARSNLAKCRLISFYSAHSGSSDRPTEAQRTTATSYALKILECDTKVMSTTLIKGYRWLNQMYFPFPAYVQVAQDLASRPNDDQSQQSWITLNNNFDAWFGSELRLDSPLFQMLVKIILQAWDAYELAAKQSGQTPVLSQMVTTLKNAVKQKSQPASEVEIQQSNTNTDADIVIDEFTTQMSMPDTSQGIPYSVGMQDNLIGMAPGFQFRQLGHGAFAGHMHPWDWTAFNNPTGWRGW